MSLPRTRTIGDLLTLIITALDKVGWGPEPGSMDKTGLGLTANFVVVRALLRKWRRYDKAVEDIQPYDRIQEVNEGAREGLRKIAQQAMQDLKDAFLFVNNRLEGNAPSTIEAVVGSLSGQLEHGPTF
jgi:hypothetical protein